MTTNPENRITEDFDINDVQSILSPDGKLMAVVFLAIPDNMTTAEFGDLLTHVGQHVEFQSDFGVTDITDGFKTASGIVAQADDGHVVLPYAIQAISADEAQDMDPWAALSHSHLRISEAMGIEVEVRDRDESSRS